MATKHQVIELHRKQPALTSKQIASLILGEQAKDFKRLTSVNGWVRRTAQREGLILARTPRVPKELRPPRRDGLLTLGRACRKVGLTLADIMDVADTIGRERSSQKSCAVISRGSNPA